MGQRFRVVQGFDWPFQIEGAIFCGVVEVSDPSIFLKSVEGSAWWRFLCGVHISNWSIFV